MDLEEPGYEFPYKQGDHKFYHPKYVILNTIQRVKRGTINNCSRTIGITGTISENLDYPS